MKIHVVSDLHLEFIREESDITAAIDSLVPADPVDVLVLAGDVTTRHNIADVLPQFAGRYPEVIFVPGNHEYYGSSFPEIRRLLADISLPNLHVLDNGCVSIKGFQFIGSTLWFPDGPGNRQYRHKLNDFHCIADFRELVYEEHRIATKFLARNVNRESIVITHHLPSFRSVGEQYHGSPFNRFFVAPMDELIADRQPRLWIHGHSHDSARYLHGETEVICNPFGYPEYLENPGFERHLVVELAVVGDGDSG